MVSVWPGDRLDDALAAKLRGAFIMGIERTGEQDAEFGMLQLVEVAFARALDPSTAINCVDRLGAALATLAGRAIPSGYRYDERGKLRVVAEFNAFADLTKAAFDQIRQQGYLSLTFGASHLQSCQSFRALVETRHPAG